MRSDGCAARPGYETDCRRESAEQPARADGGETGSVVVEQWQESERTGAKTSVAAVLGERGDAKAVEWTRGWWLRNGIVYSF